MQALYIVGFFAALFGAARLAYVCHGETFWPEWILLRIHRIRELRNSLSRLISGKWILPGGG